MDGLKIIGVLAIALILLNFVLFVFTLIPWQVFLFVLALGVAFVYWGLPRLKK